MPAFTRDGNAAEVYNAQPHIDGFQHGIESVVPNEEREDGVYYGADAPTL